MPLICATLMFSVAVLVLVGWQFDIGVLKSVLPGYISMKANTALAFLSLSISFLLLARKRDLRSLPVGAFVFAAFPAILSALTLAQYIGDFDLGIDELLFKDTDDAWGKFPPGRLAPITAVNFIFMAIAIIGSTNPWSQFYRLSQFLSFSVFLTSFQALAGYSLGIKYTFGHAYYTQIAVHTAVLFVFAGSVHLMMTSRAGFMTTLTSGTLGGIIGRRLLVGALLIPSFVNWLELAGSRAGLYDDNFGILVRVMTNTVFFLVIIWKTADELHRIDLARTKSEEGRSRLNSIIRTQQQIAEAGTDVDRLMQLVVEKTTEHTGSDGSIIELVEGDELVYRVATGPASQHSGIRLKIANSFSGLCATSGEVLHCPDTELDPRVNIEACRKVGIRSMIVVPMRRDDEICGVLKTYSSRPDAFSHEDIETLQLLAGLLGIAMATASEFTAKLESEAKFKGTFENSPIGIALAFTDGTWYDVNPAFCRMLGYTKEEICGKSINEITPESDRALGSDVRAKMLSGEVESTVIEKRYLHKQGDEIPVSIHGSVIRDSAGQPRFLMGQVIDITERKRQERDLLATNSALKDATQAKSDFLANMSHEIRTPINGVIGMTSLLADTELSSQQRDYLDTIRVSADTLLTLINDILDFSKIEARRMELESLNFDLREAVRDIERTLSFSAQRKGIAFETRLTDEAMGYHLGDPGRIKQVLLNLASNAIKFTKVGSVTVTVSQVATAGDTSTFRFEVSDTGIGIPDQVLAKLFRAFSQADASTTRRFGGTGLGLSISKNLVNLMGGKIGVESQVGKGSTFWFTLPLKKGSGRLAKGSEPHSSHAASQQLPLLRVLVAEDNVINQKIAVKMLEKLGIRADTVANGAEAIAALRLVPYDLILMDCQMPELDGYEASRQIRASTDLPNPKVPIIALTANAMQGDREKCLEAGMTDYLSKPIKQDDLEKVIHRVMATEPKKAAG